MNRFLALLLAAWLAPGSLLAAPVAPAVEFLAPAPGSAVTQAKPVLIGRLAPGREKAQILLNGQPLKGATRQGASFSAVMEPAAGRNVVEVRDGAALLGSLPFAFGPAAGTPVYAYHQAVTDGDCAECHRERQRPETKAKTCFGCHEAWQNQFTHGPVAAGECLFCHDPHGSVQPRLSRTEVKQQCTGCHSQSSSKGHLENAKNRNCTACHDPHGGSGKLLLKK